MSRPDDLVAVESEAPGLESRFQPFADALKREFDMPDEDAMATAQIVAETFGSAEEVDDDALDPEVRSIFYTLENKDLLTFRREEYTSEDGQTLRAYFWQIKDEELKQMSEQLADDANEDGVYDKVPSEVWSGRNT
jgi:Mg2+ and Co2+ transporter CorA